MVKNKVRRKISKTQDKANVSQKREQGLGRSSSQHKGSSSPLLQKPKKLPTFISQRLGVRALEN
ncbi:hypothetical protein ACP70R_048572 [Stipagrostis hirtigluma subsp. patula]